MTASVSHLTSLDEFRAVARLWDDLWLRSDSTSPTCKAAIVAHWVDHFAEHVAGTVDSSFRALIVEQGGQWVAGLPLVEKRVAGMFRVGAWPANEWSDSGDLLLDASVAPKPVLDALARSLGLLPWDGLRLDDVEGDAPRWQHAFAAFDRVGIPVHFRPEMAPGRLDVHGDWNAYRLTWSRRHRQQMARHARELASLGRVELRLLDQLPAEEVERWLSVGFEIEDRGWKGREGTSVGRTPGMFAFYLEQARELARQGELVLALLMVNEQPIAFAYGMCAKGVYRSYKVGYDPEFSRYSPGQMLRYHLLERFFHDPRYRGVDYITPTPAHLHWHPERYRVGRLYVARRGMLGRCLVSAVRLLKHRGSALSAVS
ncbi:MAG: GNAT family N-acetyltransferase [Patescibacteria group bacterium]|nr:GNAT family N-acetyltransferase [Patescibacteria group bacterium]